ncbi:MAG: DUF4423 domain-containing protein [Pseudobacteriovorax sp.]|nr:DUF4423 domain-containing protein [Pseudobacteriovorax sp.]
MNISSKLMLKQELLERKSELGQRYSLRSYAKDLEISPGLLSRFLSGKVLISEKMSLKVLSKLDWNRERKNLFLTALRLERNPNSQDTEQLTRHRKSDHDHWKILVNREFHIVIKEWYHIAIFELLKIKKPHSISSLSQSLRISRLEAELALERLELLGLIKIAPNGNYERVHDVLIIKDCPSQYIRAYHKKMLEKAEAAIAGQCFEQRVIRGTTIAIDADDYQYIITEIDRFRKKVIERTESSCPDRLYHLSLQLFQID